MAIISAWSGDDHGSLDSESDSDSETQELDLMESRSRSCLPTCCGHAQGLLMEFT